MRQHLAKPTRRAILSQCVAIGALHLSPERNTLPLAEGQPERDCPEKHFHAGWESASNRQRIGWQNRKAAQKRLGGRVAHERRRVLRLPTRRPRRLVAGVPAPPRPRQVRAGDPSRARPPPSRARHPRRRDHAAPIGHAERTASMAARRQGRLHPRRRTPARPVVRGRVRRAEDHGLAAGTGAQVGRPPSPRRSPKSKRPRPPTASTSASTTPASRSARSSSPNATPSTPRPAPTCSGAGRPWTPRSKS